MCSYYHELRPENLLVYSQLYIAIRLHLPCIAWNIDCIEYLCFRAYGHKHVKLTQESTSRTSMWFRFFLDTWLRIG